MHAVMKSIVRNKAKIILAGIVVPAAAGIVVSWSLLL